MIEASSFLDAAAGIGVGFYTGVPCSFLTPLINRTAGRVHWGRVYSTVLSGGGVRGGQVVGRSDAKGALPAENPVNVSDFVATIYHALGYGAETRITDPLGLPH